MRQEKLQKKLRYRAKRPPEGAGVDLSKWDPSKMDRLTRVSDKLSNISTDAAVKAEQAQIVLADIYEANGAIPSKELTAHPSNEVPKLSRKKKPAIVR